MIHIFGGGTVNYIRSHLALCAPAYGATARVLHDGLVQVGVPAERIRLELTRMADARSSMETNKDVSARLDEVLMDAETSAIVFSAAICDFEGEIDAAESGKYAPRLASRDGVQWAKLTPADKLLHRIKTVRPDIVLVGFKTTAGAEEAQQIEAAKRQMHESQTDLVLANDTVSRVNIVVEANPQRYSAPIRTRAVAMANLAAALAQRLGIGGGCHNGCC